MKKLYKVRIGKPTAHGNYLSYNPDHKIKSEYFVVASTFNEAGALVTKHIERLIAQEKSHVIVTEYGLENLNDEYDVCSIELVSDELIVEVITGG